MEEPGRTLELKKILDGARQKLEITLFSDEQRLLLLECALRHDDGHSGAPYRQDVVNDGFSNEEHAVHLLDDSLRFLQESPENTPPDVDAWLANQREFFDVHIIL